MNDAFYAKLLRQPIVTFLGLLVELHPESGQVSRSAKVSPASLRKQVTVAEGEKAAAAVVSNVTGI